MSIWYRTAVLQRGAKNKQCCNSRRNIKERTKKELLNKCNNEESKSK